jgi:NAD(P)-dependent dehydrogenase (short-subunit alcohol dehydrogenase family)
VSHLKDRVAIVTGAGRGIGAAVAMRLAAEGAAVVVNDLGAAVDGSGRDEGPAAQLRRAIVDAGGSAISDDSDIADFEQARRLVDDTVSDLGRLDILVNAAGILRDRMIFNMTEDEWDSVIRVHLKGTFNTSRHAAEHWRNLRNPDGNFRLINFASTSGLFGMPSQPNYGAAKMGIVGLTYNVANTLDRYGVTANAIAPSADTRMTETVIAAARRREPRRPEDVATVVAYLATPAAGWCNGRVIGVGGTEVTLYSDPQAIRQVVSNEPWEFETLGAALERTFAPVPRGSAGRWDNVRTSLAGKPAEAGASPSSAMG